MIESGVCVYVCVCMRVCECACVCAPVGPHVPRGTGRHSGEMDLTGIRENVENGGSCNVGRVASVRCCVDWEGWLNWVHSVIGSRMWALSRVMI